MITTKQLALALEELGVNAETTLIAAELKHGLAAEDHEGIGRAALAGLLFRLAGMAASETISLGSDIPTMEARASAASPKSSDLPNEHPADQARFEAFWLAERLATIKSDGFSWGPEFDELLSAIRGSVEAARSLLTIYHGLSCGLWLDASYSGWDVSLYQLGAADRSVRMALGVVERAWAAQQAISGTDRGGEDWHL
ncbi:hypothetical protein [Nocardia vulneris]|uniref:Uncharacterized protein n=1 Tax=Nocardia vulneris TaxID=1141657 RepID=A0ABR4ZDJ4_9NOCA|nr:hypothetical protein [Nocardia vulneris]KIA63385.1 hypothetical protein FG87_19505 [Nocardia vulneris]